MNLANNPQNEDLLADLRAKTVDFDNLMKPVSTIYNPKNMDQTIGLVEWIKTEHPEIQKQMEEGVEVGFKKW